MCTDRCLSREDPLCARTSVCHGRILCVHGQVSVVVVDVVVVVIIIVVDVIIVVVAATTTTTATAVPYHA